MISIEKIPALIINLERDADRLALVLKQFDVLPNFFVVIVSAVEGYLLSDHTCFLLTKDHRWTQFKGTIGCFLSHVKAWEKISKLSVPFAVVLEDDAEVSNLKLLSSLTVPDDAEIVFLNERMSPNFPPSEKILFLPLFHALKRLDEMRSGPGGDGYLLTPAAAAKLLNACLIDTYFGHVDGRLMQYATSESDLGLLPADSWIETVVRNHRHPTFAPKLGLLRGYCLSRALISHRGIPSSRELGDRPDDLISNS